MGSMKSGPTLNPCTCTPRLRRAPRIPSTMDVLPTPLCVPAITRRGHLFSSTGSATISNYHPTPPQGRRQAGRARGIHHTDSLGDTRTLERLKGVAQIWPHVFYTVVRIGTTEPNPKRPGHRGLCDTGIGTRMFTPVAPADTPTTAGLSSGEPRSQPKKDQPYTRWNKVRDIVQTSRSPPEVGV